MKPIIDWLLANPGTVLTVVLFLVGLWKGQPFIKAKLQEPRTMAVLRAAHQAFGYVQEWSRTTARTEDDKIAAFLLALADNLIAMGAAPPTAEEQAMAQRYADGLHAETKGRPSLAPAL